MIVETNNAFGYENAKHTNMIPFTNNLKNTIQFVLHKIQIQLWSSRIAVFWVLYCRALLHMESRKISAKSESSTLRNANRFSIFLNKTFYLLDYDVSGQKILLLTFVQKRKMKLQIKFILTS